MIITTLPITPGKLDLFVTLFGPLVADILAKLTGSQFKMVLNVNHSFRSFESRVDKYIEQLERMEISPIIAGIDSSDEYRTHIQNLVIDLYDRNLLSIKEIDLIHCECGIVELPYDAYRNINKQERAKFSSNDICSKCDSHLILSKEKALMLNLPQMARQTKVISQIYTKHFQQSFESLRKRPMVISRSYRNGVEVVLGDSTFKLDADFCWATYLIYMNDAELCIISASSTINATTKSLALLNVYKPNADVQVIVHPMVCPVNSEKTILSKMTIEEYLNVCKDEKIARGFLSLGIQWGQSKVPLNAYDLHKTEKSVYPKQSFTIIKDDCVVTPRNFCKIVNKNNILKLFKAMRGNQTDLSVSQGKLKQALLGCD